MISYNYKNIKHLRHVLGLTKAQFARKIGRSRQYIHKLENGTAVPSMDTLLNIMRAFNLEPGFFFTKGITCTYKNNEGRAA